VFTARCALSPHTQQTHLVFKRLVIYVFCLLLCVCVSYVPCLLSFVIYVCCAVSVIGRPAVVDFAR
jgi:hypothetical protein